jgi:hypothetical protein
LLLNTIDAPRSEAELDELLSAPTPETVEAVSRLEGDLLLLGAGGKMGSSLARLAKRSIEAAGLGHRVICVSRFGSGTSPQSSATTTSRRSPPICSTASNLLRSQTRRTSSTSRASSSAPALRLIAPGR